MAGDAETVRLHARIHGRVQGVFYRASTQRDATGLGLCGWVRNCADGTVELVAEGPRPACEELLRRCRAGPPAARVTSIDVNWGAPGGGFSTFEVRHA